MDTESMLVIYATFYVNLFQSMVFRLVTPVTEISSQKLQIAHFCSPENSFFELCCFSWCTQSSTMISWKALFIILSLLDPCFPLNSSSFPILLFLLALLFHCYAGILSMGYFIASLASINSEIFQFIDDFFSIFKLYILF